jgi:hypothetical protein
MYAKNTYRTKIKSAYEYGLDGVAIAIGDIGIIGYMAYILISLSVEDTYNRYDHKGRPETATVNSGIVMTSFYFVPSPTMRRWG